MLDVYEGTLGAFFNKGELEVKLNKYLTNVNKSLAYEFKEDKTKLVIITGANEYEQELPHFGHPFIFDDLYHRKVIAIDLRPYMKNHLDDMVTVREKLQDKYNGNLQLQRTIFTQLMLDNETEWRPYLMPRLIEAFAAIISSITSIIVFNKEVIDPVKVIAKLHMVTMDDPEDTNYTLYDYITRLDRNTITSLTHGDLKSFYSYLETQYKEGHIKLPSRTIDTLTNNIKYSLETNRGKGLDPDIYIQSLSRGFFSLDSKYITIAMIEHIPTFISIIINVMLEGVNSKSSFRKILESNKRIIKPKELAIDLRNIYEDRIL